jgi:hypothetical protein
MPSMITSLIACLNARIGLLFMIVSVELMKSITVSISRILNTFLLKAKFSLPNTKLTNPIELKIAIES